MNLCILCLDALRYDHVTPEVMPFLSGLAASGRRYTNVYVEQPWTPSSVAAMLTGDDKAFERGTDGMVGCPTLPEMLARTHDAACFFGQPTAALTKELGWIWESFDRKWSCTDTPGWPTRARGMDEVWPHFFEWREDGTRSWFAYVHLYEVHEPYTTGPILAQTPQTFANGFFTHRVDSRDHVLEATEEEQASLRTAYRDYCRATDAKLAEVLPRVLDGQTLLFIVSDHGDLHGEGGIWGHGPSAPYQTEAAQKVFWAVVGPGVEAGEEGARMTNAELPRIVTEQIRAFADGEVVDAVAVAQRLRDLGYLGGV